MSIANDMIPEGDENFTVSLTLSPGTHVTVDPSLATVTILDDDGT